MSMRELWWRACGAWDRTVALKATVLGVMGVTIRPDGYDELHPLRAMEKPPPTAEELARMNEVAFDVFGRALKAHTDQTRG